MSITAVATALPVVAKGVKLIFSAIPRSSGLKKRAQITAQILRSEADQAEARAAVIDPEGADSLLEERLIALEWRNVAATMRAVASALMGEQKSKS